ncbi:FecR family protein [Parapedobacter tibetensis]|uniref:FecR family protein n=1 Tax=Parapedobacter tibetensis TaxID=2972951 RepID=UPI00214D3613|nr:FecR domain-containing protein [Parapedobacter tibetensis]
MGDNAEDILSDEQGKERMNTGQTSPKQNQLAANIVRAMKEVNTKNLNKEDKEYLWNRIRKGTMMNGGSTRTISQAWRYGAAAAVVLCCSVALWWFASTRFQDDNELVRTARDFQERLHGLDSLGLALDNDAVMQLEDETAFHFKDSSLTVVGRNGTQQDIAISGEGDYNTLAVPYGKRTEVILPDGTKVWLNAGSYFTFPKRFMGEKREVFLQGEAYFEVSHNREKPFFVYADDMQIKVLGTSFNVSSYKDDNVSSAVLLDGAIELTPQGKAKFEKQILSKGITATFNKINGQLGLETTDAQDRITWTHKQLILKSTPLPELIKKLERVYNAEIRYKIESDGAEDDRFSGIIDLKQALDSVLQVIYDPSLYRIQQEGRRFVISEK